MSCEMLKVVAIAVAICGILAKQDDLKMEDLDLKAWWETEFHPTFEGRLKCDGGGLRNLKKRVRVELYEQDLGQQHWFDPDDFLGATYADPGGYYFINGTSSEIGEIEPYIEIIHTCGGPCRIVRQYTPTPVIELFENGRMCPKDRILKP
ncbi:unnamed protein product [Bursaphelenchus xylophilus]|uniref:(pine wood nematode) hypothetical protein n=1 Tax=Bursaphelenchus xylophilus TaxID=6326 RepID=A0A1I7RJV4_BURXY|nr:unnamed protein product [Bursaphelenchus xylophilus]CAG9129090.1 unnamed protein product [Bursaphelenchus xylophilus]